MYIPTHFAAPDLDTGLEVIDRYGFATLVTVADGLPFATHLPLLLDRQRGPRGSLLGHVARANPQWRHLDPGQPVLAIFAGPHAFVSPSWYAPRPENVPTWNYVAVHVRGRPRLLDGGADTLAVVERLTAQYDTSGYHPDVEGETIQRMSRGIVAFAIEIDEVLTKLKLSQNRTAEDRDEVERRLAAGDDDDARGVASWMQRLRDAADPRG